MWRISHIIGNLRRSTIGKIMDGDRNGSAFRALWRVRQIFDEGLNPCSSLIALDLLLATATRQLGGRASNPFTVKQLFAQLRHSDRALRIHFNRLVADGFIAAEPGRDDRRTKLVRLTPRGEQLLKRVASGLFQTLSREARRTAHPATERSLRAGTRSPA
jgi:DNA-binding MarR family transcriptional regulator